MLAELRCLQGLLLLLSLLSKWWLPWKLCVLQSDASLHGWALAHSFCPRETVADVARTLERSRFRRIGANTALESALVAAWLEMKLDWHWRPRENVSHPDEKESRELYTGFEEVPWSILRCSRWKHVRKGVWRFSEDIAMLEARATVFSPGRLARTRYGGSVRKLFSVAIWELRWLWKAGHFGVLTRNRHFQSYCLALGIQGIPPPDSLWDQRERPWHPHVCTAKHKTGDISFRQPAHWSLRRAWTFSETAIISTLCEVFWETRQFALSVVGSSSEHEQFSHTALESHLILGSTRPTVKVRKRLPPESTSEVSPRLVWREKTTSTNQCVSECKPFLQPSSGPGERTKRQPLDNPWWTTRVTTAAAVSRHVRQDKRKEANENSSPLGTASLANPRWLLGLSLSGYDASAIQSISREILLAARPRGRHDNATAGYRVGPQGLRVVRCALLGRRTMRLWRANDGGILRCFPSIQQDWSLKATAYLAGPASLATTHTQPCYVQSLQQTPKSHSLKIQE